MWWFITDEAKQYYSRLNLLRMMKVLEDVFKSKLKDERWLELPMRFLLKK